MNFFDILDFGILDVLDIFLVALLLYYVYQLVKGTAAINIFIGIVVIAGFWKITQLLEMRMISGIVGSFIDIGLIALMIVFQQEIRKFLLLIGSTNFTAKSRYSKYFKFLKQEEAATSLNVDAVLAACQVMGKSKTGALLVLERTTNLDFVARTGDSMNIEVTQPIVESIFFKNSPLHDGAAIIRGNHIVATRVILPVSNERNIPLNYGLRHRAAIGITEKTDALCLVVSEETGKISYIKNATFVDYGSLEQLSERIKRDL